MQTTLARTRRAEARRENIAGYVFMLPSLLFFAGFVLFPMGMCLFTSFFDYSMDSFAFTGLSNYQKMLGNGVFWKSLVNTVVIVVTSVPTVCLFSLWVASAVYRLRDRFCSFFRCVFYLPVVTGTVAVTVVWKWMFNKYTGLFNVVLKQLGLITQNVSWLGDASTALACIILILFTTSVGQPIVLYISALCNVDHSLVEAAQVDGATGRQVFWRVKWPQIMPTTLYILVITTINSFQCFALIQLLTSGGPNYATSTIMYNIYYEAFKLNNYGYGNAMGVTLALVIAAFSALQFRLARTDNG